MRRYTAIRSGNLEIRVEHRCFALPLAAGRIVALPGSKKNSLSRDPLPLACEPGTPELLNFNPHPVV